MICVNKQKFRLRAIGWKGKNNKNMYYSTMHNLCTGHNRWQPAPATMASQAPAAAKPAHSNNQPATAMRRVHVSATLHSIIMYAHCCAFVRDCAQIFFINYMRSARPDLCDTHANARTRTAKPPIMRTHRGAALVVVNPVIHARARRESFALDGAPNFHFIINWTALGGPRFGDTRLGESLSPPVSWWLSHARVCVFCLFAFDAHNTCCWPEILNYAANYSIRQRTGNGLNFVYINLASACERSDRGDRDGGSAGAAARARIVPGYNWLSEQGVRAQRARTTEHLWLAHMGGPVGGLWPVVGSRPHPPDGRNHTMYLACIEWRWCERVEVSLFFQFRVGQLSLHWLWNRMNSVEMVYNVDLIGNELIFEWHEQIHWLLYVSHYCGANNVRVQLL